MNDKSFNNARLHFRRMKENEFNKLPLAQSLKKNNDILQNEELIDSFMESMRVDWEGCSKIKKSTYEYWKLTFKTLLDDAKSGADRQVIKNYRKLIQEETSLLDSDLMDKEFNGEDMSDFLVDVMTANSFMSGEVDYE